MRKFSLTSFVALLAACSHAAPAPEAPVRDLSKTVAPASGETHFRTLKQITFGGENAEAYFSPNGKWLTLQSTREGRTCDQQYLMRIDGSGARRISDGRGKTTCGWFFPG